MMLKGIALVCSCMGNTSVVKETIHQNIPGTMIIIETENTNTDMLNVDKVKDSIIVSLGKEDIKGCVVVIYRPQN